MTRVAVAAAGATSPHVELAELPAPGPHQLVVNVLASGICRSQLHHMRRPRTTPIALGHEAVGTVTGVGAQVRSASAGDRVLITWLPHGHGSRKPTASTLTLASGEAASTSDVFTWADRTVVDEAYTVRVPSDVTADTVAVLGCAVLTGAGAICRTAGVRAGESVAVIGVGGVGACAVAAASILGAHPVVAIDVDDANLDLARKLGATHTAWRNGLDHVIDCVGTSQTLAAAIDALRPEGTAVLVGVPPGPLTIDARQLQLTQKRLLGCFGGSSHPADDLPRYLHWYTEGKLDLDTLVTHRYPLDDVARATNDLANGKVRGRALLLPDLPDDLMSP